MSAMDSPTADLPHADAPTGPIPAVSRNPGGSSDTARHRLHEDTGGPGTTRFESAAVEKLAVQAVSEVDHIGGAANRMLGVPVGSDSADRRPKVSAQVDGTVVTLTVRLSVIYPAPVGRTTEQVRAHLRERLSTLADLDARRVDITVAALHTPAAQERRLA